MKIGLVLSGGGVRGIAHIGAIKALEENGIFPTHISGTSAGAIVGALYANNIQLEDIFNFFKHTPIFQTQKYALGKPGFVDSEKFYNSFKELLPEDKFEALQKTLFITGTDVLNGDTKIFNKGELIKPILASASFPGVFTPVEIKQNLYVDGGVLNNFPTEPLLPVCDIIIGVFVTPLKKIASNDLKNSYNVLERSYNIKMVYDSMLKFKDCDLVINPTELSEYSVFRKQGIDEIFQIGYNRTTELLAKTKLSI